MKRIALTGAALALLVLPAPSVAQDTPSPTQNASQACRAERDKVGTALFKTTWGTNKNKSNAFGKCVSGRKSAEAGNVNNAAKTCKAERDDPNFAANHGGKTFAQYYGTNKGGRNAYGKCVSGKAKAASQAQTTARVNAAKACKAERADADFASSHGGKTFAEFYGTNKGNRNAFGKCVSTKAKAQNDA